MSLSKHSFKKQMLERSIERDSKGSASKDKPEVLPYYKLDFNEKMEVAFIPYEDGDLFKHFKRHGGNLGVSGVGSVDCIWHSRGESCPACAKGYTYVENGKGTPMSKKWMAKDTFVAQVVVLSAPFDIEPLEDGNEVRLFYMPFAVKEKIIEAFQEGIIEDPTQHTFVIKKTKSAGGEASYQNSYFIQQPISDDVIAAFEGAKVEVLDLEALEVAPKYVTAPEIEDWIVKVEAAMSGGDSAGRSQAAAESAPQEAPRTNSGGVAARLAARRQEPADNADQPQQQPANEVAAAPAGGALSLRERLAASRRQQA